LDALKIQEGGHFLEGVRSAWAVEQAQDLEMLAVQARLDGAGWAFDIGRYSQAEALVDSVVLIDPYRERAWRLRMKLLGALGDSDGVVSCYRRCAEALANVGLEPAPSTKQLLDQLRR
jgi:DNA-binding SARP family transcriptional activator